MRLFRQKGLRRLVNAWVCSFVCNVKPDYDVTQQFVWCSKQLTVTSSITSSLCALADRTALCDQRNWRLINKKILPCPCQRVCAIFIQAAPPGKKIGRPISMVSLPRAGTTALAKILGTGLVVLACLFLPVLNGTARAQTFGAPSGQDQGRWSIGAYAGALTKRSFVSSFY